MTTHRCIKCGSSLADGEEFCAACGAPRSDASQQSAGKPDEPNVEGRPLAAPPRPRRKYAVLAAALLAVVAVGAAGWFLLLRETRSTSAAQEQQTLNALVTQMAQADSLTQVSDFAGAAQNRVDDLATLTYTNSSEDQRLTSMQSLYAALAALRGSSASNPTVWDQNKQTISAALDAVTGLPDNPPVTADQAQNREKNLSRLAETAKEYTRKQQALDRVQAVAYEFKHKRDALNPYFTTSSTGSDMYTALRRSPARWKRMQTELSIIDVSGAPGIAAARDELDAALARGRTGIGNFLRLVSNTPSCAFDCWYGLWKSTAGQYSKRNDVVVKRLLERQLPGLQDNLRNSEPR